MLIAIFGIWGLEILGYEKYNEFVKWGENENLANLNSATMDDLQPQIT
jgi:hypothetical protein